MIIFGVATTHSPADFLCQFGYSPNPKNPAFETRFADDKVKRSFQGSGAFKQGYVSFAGSGPNSRNSHLFVTLGHNVRSLGREPWETPIGQVTVKSFASTVAKWTTKYGDMSAFNKGGADPHLIETQPGYVEKHFPEMDSIISCTRREEAKPEEL
jgi:cyclophilin family peptidyl-prolyl cis-trans isomerase